MRWLPAAAVLLALPGCLEPSMDGVRDCSSDREILMPAEAEVLLPASVPDEVRESFGKPARVTVHAREGQTLTAQATWVASAGAVGVEFDGPREWVVETDQSMTVTSTVPEGDYTLELVGDPIAYKVAYAIILVASGCTWEPV